MGHSWTSQDFSLLATVGGGQEHPKDTCRDLSPVPCSHFQPRTGRQLCLAACAGSGGCLSHRAAAPPAPGASAAAPAAHRPARGSHTDPCRVTPAAALWSRPKAVTSGVPCHFEGCACVPARTLLLPSTCGSYRGRGGGCLAAAGTGCRPSCKALFSLLPEPSTAIHPCPRAGQSVARHRRSDPHSPVCTRTWH